MKKTDTGWMSDSNCKGKTDVFYGPSEERLAMRRVRERQAKEICLECKVMLQCRQYARENNELGFWGAEGEEERFTNGFLNDPFVRRRLKHRADRAARH